MSDQLQRMMKQLEGDGPIEKQIILLKLTEALENSPEFGDKPLLDPATPQRQWLSQVGALLTRLGIDKKMQYRATFSTLTQYWPHAIVQIKGQVLDAIEELKLELELDDRSDIGTAYAPGDVYRFFADLKDVINSASTDVMIVDPYFNGEAFDAYLSTADTALNIKILADRYSKDISDYIEKHKVQFKTETELRRSKKLHDRIIFIDDESAWIMGGSIKDAGKKATYLIPLASQLSATKKEIYNIIWNEATVIEKSV